MPSSLSHTISRIPTADDGAVALAYVEQAMRDAYGARTAGLRLHVGHVAPGPAKVVPDVAGRQRCVVPIVMDS